MPYFQEQYNPFLLRAQKLYEANSGMNTYNRMMQTGAARIARGQSDYIDQVRGMIGRNPALLRDIIADIGQQSAGKYADLSVSAEKLLSDLNLAERNRLTNVGLSAEQNQLARDELAQRKKGMWADIITGLIGGGLSAGGSIYGAKLGADAMKDLMKMIALQGVD